MLITALYSSKKTEGNLKVQEPGICRVMKMFLKNIFKMDTTHDATKWIQLYEKCGVRMWVYACEQVWIKKTKKKYTKGLTRVITGLTGKFINVVVS